MPGMLMARAHRSLVFVTGDPNDPHSEASRGIRYALEGSTLRIDPCHDGRRRHGGIPSLDIRQTDAACRPDQSTHLPRRPGRSGRDRRGQVRPGVAHRRRSPHLRLEKRYDSFRISRKVEQIVRHPLTRRESGMLGVAGVLAGSRFGPPGHPPPSTPYPSARRCSPAAARPPRATTLHAEAGWMPLARQHFGPALRR